MPQGDSEYYRRRLPHWREKDGVYFVTWRLRELTPPLSAEERDLIADALRHFEGRRYELFGYVVMNDHVHVVVRPIDPHSLIAIIHSWKSFTANRLQREHRRHGGVWQDEYFDRLIRSELTEKLEYIANNPRKRWPEIVEYRWVWIAGLNGDGPP